ncbi:hypothetical protein ACR3K2_00920 [Cryptosporidium serpentis]
MLQNSIVGIADKIDDDNIWNYETGLDSNEEDSKVVLKEKRSFAARPEIHALSNQNIVAKSSIIFQRVQASERRINSLLDGLGTDIKHFHILFKQRQFTFKPQGRKQLFYTPDKMYTTPDLWLFKPEAMYDSTTLSIKDLMNNILEPFPNIGREWYSHRFEVIKKLT